LDYEYRASGDYITITRYIGTQTVITVPAQIDGKTVYHLDTAAFEGKNLTHVVLSPGIACIHTRAFANCPDLVEIVIPASVIKIWPNVFSGSDKLVIVSDAGTEAQTYANDEGIPWRPLP